jgi:hypothetical protein
MAIHFHCRFQRCVNSSGLVVFHSDPKLRHMSYMKTPPILMKRNELFVFSVLQSSLKQRGLALPKSFHLSRVQVAGVTVSAPNPEASLSNRTADAASLRTCTLSEALAVLTHNRETYATELASVQRLLDTDHYHVFKLRHVVATFDRIAARLKEHFESATTATTEQDTPPVSPPVNSRTTL